MGIFERWKKKPEAPPAWTAEEIEEREQWVCEHLPDLFDFVQLESEYSQSPHYAENPKSLRTVAEATHGRHRDWAKRAQLLKPVEGQEPELSPGTWAQDTMRLLEQMKLHLQQNFNGDTPATPEERLQALQSLQALQEQWQDEHGIERLGEENTSFDIAIHDLNNTVGVDRGRFKELLTEHQLTPATNRIVKKVVRQGYRMFRPGSQATPESYSSEDLLIFRRARVEAIVPERLNPSP